MTSAEAPGASGPRLLQPMWPAGVVESGAIVALEKASGTGIHLWASFNGQQLYVATEAANVKIDLTRSLKWSAT